MFVRVWSVAAVVAAFVATEAAAQSVAEIGGPRELPPPGFTQQQYVDSRGCAFLRAGLGGQVRWVPRVGDNRRVVCGLTPTLGAQAQAAASLAQAPAEPAPAPTVAPAPAAPERVTQVTPPRPAASARIPVESYAPAPVANLPPVRSPAATAATAPAQVQSAPTVRTAGTTGLRIACTTSAPVAERVALRGGGTVVVCTRGDGTLNGWRAPIYPDGAPVGAAFSSPTQDAGRPSAPRYAPMGQPVGMTGHDPARAPAVAATIAVPPGYRLAWDDDRLNPLRGSGSAEGAARQDRIWTRDIPAEEVAAAPARKAALTVSSRGEAQDAAPAARALYVQVGAFGDPANARGTTARLQAAGLPVAVSRARGLQVVLAGPFASRAEAAAALSVARGAGFGDAFVR